jgi:enoyl-CoA hydratase/carnithine racemase
MIELRIEGPGKNALSDAMIDRLLHGIEAAKGEPVLFIGAGDAFSAGLHLGEVAALDARGMERFLARLEGLMCAIFQYPAPTAACVNGHAIAGGSVIALCCDWRVAVPNPKVKIGLNEVALGLRFPPRILEICRRRIPWRYQEEVLLGAKLYAPREAQRVGLVDEIADDAERAARAHLDALACHPAEAYAATKRDLRGERPSDLVADATWTKRVAELLPAWTAPALKERILAAIAPKT